jgi:hypothetical protein
MNECGLDLLFMLVSYMRRITVNVNGLRGGCEPQNYM